MTGTRVSRSVAARAGFAAAGLTLTLTAGLAAPASASTGWHLVYRHHFGAGAAYNGLAAVVAPTASRAWAFGGVALEKIQQGAPLAERWNGSGWQAVALPEKTGGEITAGSAPGANDVWAVSSLGGYVLHWDGAKWSVAKKWPVNTSLPMELTGVTAFSATNVWVFGGSGAYPGLGTWHLRGKTWTHVTGAGANLVAASALSPTNMWAIGGVSGSYNAVFHYNGTAWKQVAVTALSGLGFQSILAMSPSNIWLAATVGGDATKPKLLHLRGGRWRAATMPWTLVLADLTADGQGGFWAAGYSPSSNAVWAVHRSSGGTWSRQQFTNGGPEAFALISGTTSLWGVGGKATSGGGDAAIWRH